MNIKEIDVKTVLSKSNLPVSDYAVNPYVGILPNFIRDDSRKIWRKRLH